MLNYEKDKFLLNGFVNELDEKQLIGVCGGNYGYCEVELDWDEAQKLKSLCCFKEEALRKFEESFPNEKDRKMKIALNCGFIGDDIKDIDVKIFMFGDRGSV